MIGITSIAAYMPRFSMSRSVIAEQLAWFDPAIKARAKGRRSIANWDEDALTMAVAAGRKLNIDSSNRLIFATTTAPFLDRSNAGLIVEALSLDKSCVAVESTGSQRAATSALLNELLAAKNGQTVLLAADRRIAMPASAQEMQYGDGAAAVAVGTEACIAEFVGGVSEHSDLIDHYRTQDKTGDYQLEDRWIRDLVAGDLVPKAIKAALSASGFKADQINHLILPLAAHHSKVVLKHLSVDRAVLADNLYSEVGDTGVAHSLLMFGNTLGIAKPGEIICMVGVGQGVDVILFRASDIEKNSDVTDALTQYRSHAQLVSDYIKLPTFSRVWPLARGIRAEADKRTAMSAYYRNRKVINSMLGSRCTACNTPHFPAARVCVNCHAIDEMVSEPFAQKTAWVKSFTEDWQTATPSPPMTYGNIEFDGGGNAFLEMTDVPLGSMQVGQALEMQFRIKDYDEQRGFRRYFWKPVPLPQNRLAENR